LRGRKVDVSNSRKGIWAYGGGRQSSNEGIRKVSICDEVCGRVQCCCFPLVISLTRRLILSADRSSRLVILGLNA
jgi:hypothetical protein